MRASMESLQPNSISNLLLWRNVSKDSIQFNWDIGQLQRTGKRWKDDEEITLTTNIWTIHGFYVWDGRSSHVIFRSTRTSYTTINGPACSSVRLCQVSSSIPFLPTLLPLITPKRPQITPERSQIMHLGLFCNLQGVFKLDSWPNNFSSLPLPKKTESKSALLRPKPEQNSNWPQLWFVQILHIGLLRRFVSFIAWSSSAILSSQYIQKYFLATYLDEMMDR